MPVRFTTELKKFASQGEKTGWTYLTISKKVAEKLNPGIKKSFRVKGTIDDHPIQFIALMPLGEGEFILSVNAEMRKGIKKIHGSKVSVRLEVDHSVFVLSPGLLSCLEDAPDEKMFFDSLLPSHQRYFSNWIESAKTESTKITRIARVINALTDKLSYSEMLRLNAMRKKM